MGYESDICVGMGAMTNLVEVGRGYEDGIAGKGHGAPVLGSSDGDQLGPEKQPQAVCELDCIDARP